MIEDWANKPLAVELPLFSVWSFGVMLYELATGVDLFQKDLGKDKMVRETDREKLLSWRELTNEKLDLVFEHAMQNETKEDETKQITRARQLVTQDLIAVRVLHVSVVIEMIECYSSAFVGFQLMGVLHRSLVSGLFACVVYRMVCAAPSDRPSMDEILSHPFFIENDDELDEKIQLPPKLMPHQGEIDVMFSYQSNNVLEMTRLSRSAQAQT